MTKAQPSKDGKYSAIALVRAEFDATMQEMKDLPAKDRTELASAIATMHNIPKDQLGFEPVEY